MPTVLAQSNLPKSAAVVVSSETIILRDPDNSILEKYTSDEQRQKALNSYGVKPAVLLSPGSNNYVPRPEPPVVVVAFEYSNGTEFLPILANPPHNVTEVDTTITASASVNGGAPSYVGAQNAEAFQIISINTRFVSNPIEVSPGMKISFSNLENSGTQATCVFLDAESNPFAPADCIYTFDAEDIIVPEGAKFIVLQMMKLAPNSSIIAYSN